MHITERQQHRNIRITDQSVENIPETIDGPTPDFASSSLVYRNYKVLSAVQGILSLSPSEVYTATSNRRLGLMISRHQIRPQCGHLGVNRDNYHRYHRYGYEIVRPMLHPACSAALWAPQPRRQKTAPRHLISTFPEPNMRDAMR